jgi:hypothetical protein
LSDGRETDECNGDEATTRVGVQGGERFPRMRRLAATGAIRYAADVLPSMGGTPTIG